LAAISAQLGLARSGASVLGASGVLTLGVLGVALLFGGGTRSGLTSDVISAIVAWPVLVAVLPLSFLRPELRDARPYAFAAFGLLLVPLVQLVPLPPWLWSSLSGRQLVSNSLAAGGLPLGWRPMTVSSAATTSTLSSLAAPLAVFLLALQTSRRERRIVLLCVMAFGIGSVVLGFLQISQGPASPLRFFAITNDTEAVGFFANRNHFAALLYMLLPIVAAWVIAAAMDLSRGAEKGADGRTIVVLAVLVGLYALIFLAQGMTRSRAGIGIGAVAALVSLALVWPLRRNKQGFRTARYLLTGAAIGCVLAANFAFYRVLQRDVDIVDQYRLEMTQETWRDAQKFWPLGSGMGTFVPVYSAYERTGNAGVEYVNRAHNDFVETLLEAGVVAPLVLILFLGWWLYRARRIWSAGVSSRNLLDVSLMRATSIAVLLPILHSAFDYPLRTEALMALFALFAALMIEPVAAIEDEEGRDRRHLRGRGRRRRSGPSPAPRPGPEPAEFLQ
jgi:hypothetical protein